jgi:hypothetical protein
MTARGLVQRVHRLFAAAVLHPAAELYAIVRALVGVAVDVAGEGGDKPAGLDSKIVGDERDIQEAKGFFTRFFCDIFFVRGALPMSADDYGCFRATVSAWRAYRQGRALYLRPGGSRPRSP